MKNVKVVQVFFLLICLIGYKNSFAQADYLVMAGGDTIKGKIKYLNYGVEKKVQLTIDNKKTVYSILQTTAFSMGHDLYHTVRFGQGYTYMKVMKNGYLSLYAFQQPNQVTWDGRYFLKKDGSNMEIPNIGFKKNVKNFLSDCPEVVTRIESGELTKSKINEIVDGYNHCIDLNTKGQRQIIQLSKETSEKIRTWNELEADIKNLEPFERRTNALEMIQEIKTKISNGEKIPNFLIEGLKEALKDQSTIQGVLEGALREIKN